jgi:alpha-glucosidase
LFKGLIADNALAGIWNDMNEPAVMCLIRRSQMMYVTITMGIPAHRKAHNIYGTNDKATYEGQEFIYPKRPFVITRSAYSGTQRYTSSWFGDNKGPKWRNEKRTKTPNFFVTVGL